MLKGRIKISVKKITNLFLALFLLTFTFPLRKILYDTNSFTGGLFSEFLTIFLEASEFFLALGILFFGFFLILNQEKIILLLKGKIAFFLLLIFLLGYEIAIFFAADKTLAFFKFLELIKILIICFLYLKSSLSWSKIIKILFLVALGQSFLGIGQFFAGKSLGVNFLGEQILSATETGSPTIFLKDYKFLRASGTFLHPNILAGFLVFVFFMMEKLKTNFKILRFLLIFPLILTFSRAGILALILGSFFSYQKKEKIIHLILFTIIFFIILLLIFPVIKEIFITRFQIDQSFMERLKLINFSWLLFLSSPLGIGGGNFIFSLSFWPQFFPWQLQPVHNIFLLAANEGGILAFLSLFFLFLFLIIESQKTRSLLIAMFIFASLDHFLLTIFAGKVILALSFAFALKEINQKENLQKIMRKNLWQKFIIKSK